MKANNCIILIGRLTRDPSDRSKDGYTMATFTLAVDNKSRNNEETDFFDCVAFGKTADTVLNYCAKGRLVAIVGSAHIRSYKDREGHDRKTVSVSAEAIQFLEKPAKAQPTLPRNNEAWQSPLDFDLPQPMVEVSDEELPF